jgi:hypothetical protein
MLKKRLIIILLPLLLTVLFAATADFFYLRFSRAALRSGTLAQVWLPRTGLTAKVGVSYYAKRIPTSEYVGFIQRNNSESDKAFIIALLGWLGRSDSLDEITRLSTASTYLGRCATLSAVALRSKINFARRDMSEEYYRGYSQRAIELAKQRNISLMQAAEHIASEIVGENMTTNTDQNQKLGSPINNSK